MPKRVQMRSEELAPLQKRFAQVRSDKAYLNEVMSNAERAFTNASKMLRKVYKKISAAPKSV